VVVQHCLELHALSKLLVAQCHHCVGLHIHTEQKISDSKGL
jgi:hypothetical protein